MSVEPLGLAYICEGLKEQRKGLVTLVLWNNQLTHTGMAFLGMTLVSAGWGTPIRPLDLPFIDTCTCECDTHRHTRMHTHSHTHDSVPPPAESLAQGSRLGMKVGVCRL